jgi:hypothetical protein
MNNLYVSRLKRRHAKADAQRRAYKQIAKNALVLVDLYGVKTGNSRVFESVPIDSAVIAWQNVYESLRIFGIVETVGNVAPPRIASTGVPVPVPTPVPVPVPVPTPVPVPVPTPVPVPAPTGGLDYAIVLVRHLFTGEINYESAKLGDVLQVIDQNQLKAVTLNYALGYLQSRASTLLENIGLVRLWDSQILKWSNDDILPMETLAGERYVWSDSVPNDAYYLTEAQCNAEFLSACRASLWHENKSGDSGLQPVLWHVRTPDLLAPDFVQSSVLVGNYFNRQNVLTNEFVPVHGAENSAYAASYQIATGLIDDGVASGALVLGEWVVAMRKIGITRLPFVPPAVLPVELLNYGIVAFGAVNDLSTGAYITEGARVVNKAYDVSKNDALLWFADYASTSDFNVLKLVRFSDYAVLRESVAGVMGQEVVAPVSQIGVVNVLFPNAEDPMGWLCQSVDVVASVSAFQGTYSWAVGLVDSWMVLPVAAAEYSVQTLEGSPETVLELPTFVRAV